jgi:hypothetical protein
MFKIIVFAPEEGEGDATHAFQSALDIASLGYDVIVEPMRLCPPDNGNRKMSGRSVSVGVGKFHVT